MFERDKEELRSLGVPIEVGQHGRLFDDEPGYRIRPDEFALPDISLEADEAAGDRPGHQGLGARPAGRGDHRGGPQAHRGRRRRSTSPRLDIAEPRLSADEPSFDVFWEATQERHAGRRSTTAAPARPRRSTRHLQPWGVVRYSGRWYAVGFDTDRGEERVFRLSRVRGRGPAGRARPARTTSRPAPTSARPPAGSRRRRRPSGRSCWSAPGAGHALRRDAESVEPDVAGPDERDRLGPAVVTRTAASAWPTSCSATAPTSYVEEPAALRERGRRRACAATLAGRRR